jgi:hypothetical protein
MACHCNNCNLMSISTTNIPNTHLSNKIPTFTYEIESQIQKAAPWRSHCCQVRARTNPRVKAKAHPCSPLGPDFLLCRLLIVTQSATRGLWVRKSSSQRLGERRLEFCHVILFLIVNPRSQGWTLAEPDLQAQVRDKAEVLLEWRVQTR